MGNTALKNSADFFVSRQQECMILPLWYTGKDTLEIARALALPEFIIASRLAALREERLTRKGVA